MSNLLLSYLGIGLNAMSTKPNPTARTSKKSKGRTKTQQKRRSRKSASNKSKRANRR